MDARPAKRILDGDEIASDLRKIVVEVLPGIALGPDSLFFCLFADLKHLILLAQHHVLQLETSVQFHIDAVQGVPV